MGPIIVPAMGPGPAFFSPVLSPLAPTVAMQKLAATSVFALPEQVYYHDSGPQVPLDLTLF